MNRIIIIGNGFDLAHGLKTSYRDFINDFWEKEKKKVLSTGPCSYSGSNHEFLYEYIFDTQEIYVKSPFAFKDLPDLSGYEWFNHLKKCSDIKIVFKNAFLDTISTKSWLQNWVDIEEEYYQALNGCLTNKKDGAVEKLNREFSEIKTALETYLKTMPKPPHYYVGKNFQCLNKEILGMDGKPIDDMIFLNFNYTNTISYYTNHTNPIIYIHGNLLDPNNPIIFGYSNERDERSKLIENERNKEYLRNIKTPEYLRTSNYRQLQMFVEAKDYEIFIAGHSCGLSDRTLLNMLFEHKHCYRIKVFYHKIDDVADDFDNIRYNIYKLFDNKSVMLEKVVSKDLCNPLQ